MLLLNSLQTTETAIHVKERKIKNEQDKNIVIIGVVEKR